MSGLYIILVTYTISPHSYGKQVYFGIFFVLNFLGIDMDL